jgi:hypothetical protein
MLLYYSGSYLSTEEIFCLEALQQVDDCFTRSAHFERLKTEHVI